MKSLIIEILEEEALLLCQDYSTILSRFISLIYLVEAQVQEEVEEGKDFCLL